MSYLPTQRIAFQTTSPQQPVPLSASFVSAPETPAPDLPGKKIGDLLLQVLPDGNQKVTVSTGDPKKWTAEIFRQSGAALAKWLGKSGAEKISIDYTKIDELQFNLAWSAIVEGLLLGAYQFNRHKSSHETPKPIMVYLTKFPDELHQVLEKIQIAVQATLLAREWAHEPANIINPISLAERTQELFTDTAVQVTILDEKALEDMGAGAILNVGKGSKTPPRLILLRYAGKNAPQGVKPVVLIGKALTFDSGGYSIKTVESIVGMKYDKCGGIDVIATLYAAAALQLSVPIIGVIGAAENMVDSHAYRPDDIITSLSGKTIEIISTDAEGRLVLADALTYAQKQLQPRLIIDLATLTGGVVVALGRVRAGLMSNNDELANALLASGERTHERLWRLPLDDDYAKLIEGDDADLKNSGGREGHPVIGGVFLKQFVEDSIPWAHLDIAGLGDTLKELPYCPKGATGFGVRLLLDYLQTIA
ncbi:MAG TPA: leucyl aminopeptidase [Anaerolineaceae bacterium]|nr:leucyl aminopeptidase [Anaerolineaceae bacterium]